jgi:AAA domain-containing protein
MSSTRRAPEGAPISYGRYMSSPEFVAIRGIPGTVVAAKAQLYPSARKRSLLFFLQSLSLRDGGLRKVAQTLETSVRGEDNNLADLLIELCINPKFVVSFSDESSSRRSSRPLSTRIADAVREFQDAYETRVNEQFVLTTIGKEIHETLDHALATGKMVVIEGESGSGKTTAVEAWCAARQGQVRFVSLNAITHKTGFFQKLATAIGLAASKRKATDLQVKVEDFFGKTRLMLVIDEAHYLWPQHERSHSNPELVDWINTALVNQHVPVALICTDQFAKLKARVEKRTGWTSEQLEHRVKRYKKLPSTPAREDLEAVAAKLLAVRWNVFEQQWNIATGPNPCRNFIRLVVGYALTCKMPLPAISDTIEEARYQARKNARTQIAAGDLRNALLDFRIPSNAALQRAFESPEKRRIRSSSGLEAPVGAAHLQQRCNGVANVLR